MTIYIIYGEDGYNNSVVDKAFKNYSDAIDYVVKNLLAHYKDEDGEEVYASVGGIADDIYRLEVSAEKEETINSLYPNYITVSKDGKEIVDWNDW